MSRLKLSTMERVGMLGRLLQALERGHDPIVVDTIFIPNDLRAEASAALIPVIEGALAKMGIEVVR